MHTTMRYPVDCDAAIDRAIRIGLLVTIFVGAIAVLGCGKTGSRSREVPINSSERPIPASAHADEKPTRIPMH